MIMYKVHEFLSRLGLVKGAAEVAGGGDGVLLLDTSHLHAHMLGLYHDHHTKRLQGVLDTVLDLLCHALLHLQTVGIDIHHACYLRKTGDVAVGDICHMCLAIEGQHVMLAE